MLTACSSGSPASTESPSASESASSVTAGACDGDTGVTVIVDGSALEGGSVEEQCVTADEPILAADAFAAAGVETEGTDEYGDQVVCRVNGVPAEDTAIPSEDGSDYFEACESMPAAFAYWSLWVKPSGGEWGYAEEGAATLELEPGDAVELLFALNGEPAEPSS
jgi:hypothetical protein